MSIADLTIEDVRQVVREEIVAERSLTQQTVRNIVREEIVAERAITQQSIEQAIAPVMSSIEGLRKMLEEDERAESARVDRIDRRSLRTQRLLTKHLSEHRAKAA